MGKLYRYDNIEEGLSNPVILSFRLTIEIPEHLCDQLQEHLEQDEPPSNCFISQIYTKKIGETHYLVLTINLLSFYEKWADDFDCSYRNIVYLLRKKICDRFGEQFTEYFIRHEKLDCDFIEYSFIIRDKDVIRDMQECQASSEQVTKTRWDDYLESVKEKNVTKNKEYVDFLPCCIEYNYSDYAKNVDTNSLESYNSCHDDFYECYVRCKGEQLQRFFRILDKNKCLGKRGVFLKYLFDDNFKRTLCQCAYEENCKRRCPTTKTAKDLYEEFCNVFGNSLEGHHLADDDYIPLQ
ncbi:MAG: hypothetical protein J5747_10335 [Spirochaetaceae bacterium]|nr:hypothetical protein [Spirochaetaceae bacterium]